MLNHPHGGTVVILGGALPSGGGGASSGSKMLAVIPLPKKFDIGDAKPGDPLDVTAHCKLSDDGKSLEVISLDDDDSNESEDAPDGDNDADDDPGSQWEAMMDRKKQGDQ